MFFHGVGQLSTQLSKDPCDEMSCDDMMTCFLSLYLFVKCVPSKILLTFFCPYRPLLYGLVSHFVNSGDGVGKVFLRSSSMPGSTIGNNKAPAPDT